MSDVTSTPAEKPCSPKPKKSYCFLKKLCSPCPIVKFHKKDDIDTFEDGLSRQMTCTVHFTDCEPVKEINTLVCVIKKGFKSLCVMVAKKNCAKANEKFCFFVDLSGKMDCFLERLESSLCSRKQLEDLASLVQQWKKISCAFTIEVQEDYCTYKNKKDMVDCLRGCFHSIEEKLYSMIASTNATEVKCAKPAKPKSFGSVQCIDRSNSKPISESMECTRYEPELKAKDSLECFKRPEPDAKPRCPSQNCFKLKKEQCVQTSVWKLASELAIKKSPHCSRTSLPAKKCQQDNTMPAKKCCPAEPCLPAKKCCSPEPSRSKCLPKKSNSEVRFTCPPPKQISICPPKQKQIPPAPKQPQICGMTLEYTKYITDSLKSVESNTSVPDDCFRQEVPGGYAQASISKRNGQVQLQVRCLVQSDAGDAISHLKQKAVTLSQPENANNLAQNLSKMLCMSKNWYQSAKDLCNDILTPKNSLCPS